MTRFVPRARPSRADFSSLWTFSGGMIKFTLTNFGTRNLVNILLGLFAAPQQLGLYARSYSVVTAPVYQVGAIVGRVLFPILSRSRHDVALFRARWQRPTAPAVGIALPLSVGLAVCSDWIIGSCSTPGGTRWD